MCCAWPIEQADIVPPPASTPVLGHCFGADTAREHATTSCEPPAAGLFGFPVGPVRGLRDVEGKG